MNVNIAPLAAEGAMCTFILLKKHTFKDLQPPAKSDLQYKCLVLISKIVYQCIVANETSFKQFTLKHYVYSVSNFRPLGLY